MDASDLAFCTFDCYGTLIDWEGGLGTFLYDYALRHRDDRSLGEADREGRSPVTNGRELRERWEAIQFDVIQGEYRPYRDVLAKSLRLLAAERGWEYGDED